VKRGWPPPKKKVYNGKWYYTIIRPRTPTFVVNPASPQCERNLPITLNLNNTTTTDPGQSYAWYVNGSPIATTSNTTHTLTAPGTYTIKLVITDSVGCRDSASQTYVVYSKPTASFTVSMTNPCRGRQVCFTNTSTGVGPGTT
jgi:PKD repeat protein